MSDDPKSRSQLIRYLFSWKAPAGKFRVIFLDNHDANDWIVEGDFDTLDAAIKYVEEKTRGQKMFTMSVYDDRGRKVYKSDTFFY